MIEIDRKLVMPNPANVRGLDPELEDHLREMNLRVSGWCRRTDAMMTDDLQDRMFESVLWHGAIGDGVVDDTSAFQSAIDTCLVNGRPLIVPAGTYKITSTLVVGSSGVEFFNFAWLQFGDARLKWYGSGTDTVIEIKSQSLSTFDGIRLDGRSVAGTTGIHLFSQAGAACQSVTFRNCLIENCPVRGMHIEYPSGGNTMDYVQLSLCRFGYNGEGVKITGGVREVSFIGGAILNSTTYGVNIDESKFTGFGLFFGLNTTADVYIGTDIGCVHLHSCNSESEVIVKTGTNKGWSRLLPPNVLVGVNQAPNPTWPDGVYSLDYDSARALVLEGCNFLGYVNLGSYSGNVVSIQTDFYNPDYQSHTGFTGNCDAVVEIGRGDLSGTSGIWSGVFEAVVSGGNWPRGVTIYDMDNTWPCSVFYYDQVPTDARKYYFRQGDIIFNFGYSSGQPLGWKCMTTGDMQSESVPATFEAFYALEVAPTDFAESLLDDSDAATARTTLGLGDMAVQNKDSVDIDGGSIEGITDLAVADGGTGASDAGNARSNLGCGTLATQDANSVGITGGTLSGLSSLATAANARTTLGNGSTTPPLSITARSTAPSSPSTGDIYLDDGTNTVSGKPGFRRYTGSAWEDVGNPAVAQTYTTSNVTTDRDLDADSTTLPEVADVLCTLIGDLQSAGIID